MGAPLLPDSVRVWGSSAPGLVDGTPTTARFSNPANVAVGADGAVYVADFDNGAVRKISTGGKVTTLTHQSNFNTPFGMAVAPDGTLYVQTDGNDTGTRDDTTGTIWRIDLKTGIPTVVVRNIGRPRGLVVRPDGQIVMSDLVANTISVLNPVTGAITPIAGQSGTAGFTNGQGTAALFSRPYGMALMADGSVLVADQSNNCIRRVTMSGAVTTYAGTGAVGAGNGPVSEATFNAPQGVVLSVTGTVYVADTFGHTIRRISNGQVSVAAGNGVQGFADTNNLQDEFFGLEGIAIDDTGHVVWVSDGNGGNGNPFNRVRRVFVD